MPSANSSASPHIEHPNELITGEAVALDLRPASFVLRAAGSIIDYVIYIGSYILIMVTVLTLADQLGLDERMTAAIAVVGAVVCIVIAPVAVETLSRGKSVGRLVVGARIVRDDGGAIGLRHAFIRAMVGVIEIFMTFGGLAALIALLNGRAKRLGDLVAGTYAQNERVGTRTNAVFGVPVALFDWATTADVAKLPDALSRRVAHFLAQASGFTPETRDRMARSLASEVSIYVSPIPATDAESFLAAVAALRRTREATAHDLEKRARESLAPVLSGLPRGFADRG